MRGLFILFCIGWLNLQAQQKFYFVAFKDKPNFEKQLYNPLSYISKKAVERRLKNKVAINQNDVPADSLYLVKVSRLPLTMYGNSRWFNGVVVLSGDPGISDSLLKLDFVSELTYLGPSYGYVEEGNSSASVLEEKISMLQETFEVKKIISDSLFEGKSYKQIKQLNAQNLLSGGNNGRGVLIAVIDAGFKNADQLSPFKHLFDQQNILSTYDFVEREEEVFDDDEHGLAVLSCLAAYQPEVLMGTAPQAEYILLRSENAASEFLTEEYLWVLAAEYADSAGADLINTSLGYTKHDDKKLGHKYGDMDGKTTIITQAVEIASSKGILVVVSAGNEGNQSWKQLCAPGDAPSAITVGAVDESGYCAGFSSIGPTADRRIKPDLMAMGKSAAVLSPTGRVYSGNGTSYASPILAGTAAMLMQTAPDKKPKQIKDAMLLSASNYYKPDKYIGSGIPDIELATKMLLITGDSIVDCRVLEDKNLHITLSSKIYQKVAIKLIDPVDGEVYDSDFKLNRGMNRILFKGYKKRSGGLYHLSVSYGTKTLETDIVKP